VPTKLIFSFFFFILFPLLKKYAKKLDHQKLPSRMAKSTARFSDVSEVSPRSPNNKHLYFVRGYCPHQSTLYADSSVTALASVKHRKASVTCDDK